MGRLDGKVAIVTGGARGVGLLHAGLLGDQRTRARAFPVGQRLPRG